MGLLVKFFYFDDGLEIVLDKFEEMRIVWYICYSIGKK